ILDLGLERLDMKALAEATSALVVAAPLSLLERSGPFAAELGSKLAAAVAAPPALNGHGADAKAAPDDLRAARGAFERAHVRRILERHAGDKVRAAQALGIDLSSLYRKISR